MVFSHITWILHKVSDIVETFSPSFTKSLPLWMLSATNMRQKKNFQRLFVLEPGYPRQMCNYSFYGGICYYVTYHKHALWLKHTTANNLTYILFLFQVNTIDIHKFIFLNIKTININIYILIQTIMLKADKGNTQEPVNIREII